MNERDITKAIENIKSNPHLKEKVIKAALSSQSKWSLRKKLQVATCFSLLVLITISGLRVGWTPATPSPQNQFSLVAAAAQKNESIIKKGESIKLQLYSQNGFPPLYIELPDNSEEWKIYNVLALKCVGENIKDITFESNRFDFTKIVILSKKEVHDLETIFQKIDDNKGDYYAKKYVIDPWAFGMAGVDNYDVSDYFNLRKYAIEDPTQVEWGYKTVGKSYTIAYEDQDDFGKQYGYKLSSHIPAETLAKVQAQWDKLTAGMSVEEIKQMVQDHNFKDPWLEFEDQIFNDMASQINGSILLVTVTYHNGATQTKRVRLNTDEGIANLTATLLD